MGKQAVCYASVLCTAHHSKTGAGLGIPMRCTASEGQPQIVAAPHWYAYSPPQDMPSTLSRVLYIGYRDTVPTEKLGVQQVDSADAVVQVYHVLHELGAPRCMAAQQKGVRWHSIGVQEKIKRWAAHHSTG